MSVAIAKLSLQRNWNAATRGMQLWAEMDKVIPGGCQGYENRKPPGFPSTSGVLGG